MLARNDTTKLDLMKPSQDNFFNYLEERRKGEEGKVRKLVSNIGDRMDELDGMYDDMQGLSQFNENDCAIELGLKT